MDKFSININTKKKKMRNVFKKLVEKICRNCIEKQLVSFGLYLLSEERENLIKNNPAAGPSPFEERMRVVYDADLQNWKSKN